MISARRIYVGTSTFVPGVHKSFMTISMAGAEEKKKLC